MHRARGTATHCASRGTSGARAFHGQDSDGGDPLEARGPRGKRVSPPPLQRRRNRGSRRALRCRSPVSNGVRRAASRGKGGTKTYSARSDGDSIALNEQNQPCTISNEQAVPSFLFSTCHVAKATRSLSTMRNNKSNVHQYLTRHLFLP